MRLLKTLLVTVLVVGLAGAAAYGTGVLTAQPSWRAAEAPREPGRGARVRGRARDRRGGP